MELVVHPSRRFGYGFDILVCGFAHRIAEFAVGNTNQLVFNQFVEYRVIADPSIS